MNIYQLLGYIGLITAGYLIKSFFNDTKFERSLKTNYSEYNQTVNELNRLRDHNATLKNSLRHARHFIAEFNQVIK